MINPAPLGRDFLSEVVPVSAAKADFFQFADDCLDLVKAFVVPERIVPENCLNV